MRCAALLRLTPQATIARLWLVVHNGPLSAYLSAQVGSKTRHKWWKETPGRTDVPQPISSLRSSHVTLPSHTSDGDTHSPLRQANSASEQLLFTKHKHSIDVQVESSRGVHTSAKSHQPNDSISLIGGEAYCAGQAVARPLDHCCLLYTFSASKLVFLLFYIKLIRIIMHAS